MARAAAVLGAALLSLAGARAQEAPPPYVRTAPLADGAGDAEDALGAIAAELLAENLLAVARGREGMAPPDDSLRSQALALLLTLRPDDTAALAVDGQLARGHAPAPLPAGTAGGMATIAADLDAMAVHLLLTERRNVRAFAAALADLARRLRPHAAPESLALLYGERPVWRPLLLPPPAEDGADAVLPPVPSVAVKLLLHPGDDRSPPAMLTVEASVQPAGDDRDPDAPMTLVLPPSLRAAAEESDAQRERFRAHANALQDILQRRHEPWPRGWQTVLSLDRSRIDHWPAAFAGFAVAVDCLITGEPPDVGCVVATGLDADGRLVPVAPPWEVMEACARARTAHVILPATSSQDLVDWLLLNPSRWPRLMEVSLHTARTPADVMALVRESRAPLLARAEAKYLATVAPLRGRPDTLAALRAESTVAALREVTELHGQHLSAQLLLRIATRTLPTSVSLRASLRELDARSGTLRPQPKGALRRGQRGLRRTPFGQAWDQLTSLRQLLHPDAEQYWHELRELARLLDRFAGKWPPDDVHKFPDEPPEVTRQRQRANALRATLNSRPDMR